MGALILSVFGKAKKKKEIFIVIPKKAPKQISNNCFRVTCCLRESANGRKMKAAKKKRMKASVKGGIFVRATLNIGEAAPQIILVIIRANTGFICM